MQDVRRLPWTHICSSEAKLKRKKGNLLFIKQVSTLSNIFLSTATSYLFVRTLCKSLFLSSAWREQSTWIFRKIIADISLEHLFLSSIKMWVYLHPCYVCILYSFLIIASSHRNILNNVVTLFSTHLIPLLSDLAWTQRTFSARS